jgi:hypothetical protein
MGWVRVLTHFGVTVTGSCSTGRLVSSHEMLLCPTMIPGAQDSYGNPAAAEQLLDLAAAAQVCRQGDGVAEPSRPR